MTDFLTPQVLLIIGGMALLAVTVALALAAAVELFGGLAGWAWLFVALSALAGLGERGAAFLGPIYNFQKTAEISRILDGLSVVFLAAAAVLMLLAVRRFLPPARRGPSMYKKILTGEAHEKGK
ncbi:hypothetical protein A3F28_00400 [Candidatus Uhrbacteria bacterium RIFCSPHIGHO2_12_FULL_57_11]|uniref:Uncharacterized protein n=3 Tax=Parcubacteria group TaxID=1794811 RepID=A0A1F7UJ64_9BACT|nr:MAG: hypothetical protein A2704_06565 [Candidatus Kaiserbacteria bacterium RIFCSPHIGHO2_01_FULL_54_36b]OGL74348.1 MAG: hypothetical protein A3D72_00815 [Candidatus Uhrbacteria bacterium RIFCSPHIGHO2_02_FULL_57_19]OGL78313.1 MAG: hypothetical protein A3F28_00400 [Candidatus Uhrbacteria bacterium RIFCSPHIGHO2_12_FULL_57_11]